MRLRVSMTVTFIVFSLLSLAAQGNAATNSLVASPTPLLADELAVTYTTLFEWDEGTVAVLSPTERRIALFRVPTSKVKGGKLREIQLAPGFASRGGDIYPDIVQRASNGWIFWLSRNLNQVAVYEQTGKLVKTVLLKSDNYSAFQIRTDGSFLAFRTAVHTHEIGYEEYNASGKHIGDQDSWLRPRKDQSRIAQLFFFELDKGARFEALAGFPYVRTTANPLKAVQLACPELGPVGDRAEASRRTDGLPPPLGTGFDPKQGSAPFLLAAARGGATDAFLLTNGGGVIRVNMSNPTNFTCWMSPLPSDTHVSTSIAASQNWVSTLSRDSSTQSVVVRVWNLAR